jgi:precorrin-2 dehydrogenase/sirohydrochlorin ferrochelatase
MSFLPVCLNMENAAIVVVGGGTVAEQKIKPILQYTHNITVCAPEILPSIQALPVAILSQSYTEAVLTGARMVYACTNDRNINRQIALDARRLRILVCVADDPEFCDFISPAIYKKDHMSVAVSSNAQDVKRSVAWRNRIAELLSSGIW